MESSSFTWTSPSTLDGNYVREDQFPARLRLLRWLGRQTWLAKGQDFLLRKIHNPDSGEHFLFDVDFFGLRYRGDLAHYIDWLVFCYGAAPYAELSLLKSAAAFLRSAGASTINFVDIGANAGHHSLFMSKVADKVYSVEPFPPLQAVIRDRIAYNHLTNVDIIPFALGESEATADYFPGTGANSGVGTLIAARGDNPQPALQIPVRVGDALFHAMGLPPINLMKVDVEGFEPHVFRGLRNRIRSDRPIVMTELTEESRQGIGSVGDFSKLFYDGAIMAEVLGRHGMPFELQPFVYDKSREVLIVPPEHGAFVTEHMTKQK